MDKIEYGFCKVCRKFYEDNHKADQVCPNGHYLLHEHKCDYCEIALYFQSDAAHSGPDRDLGVFCDTCARRMSTDDNWRSELDE